MHFVIVDLNRSRSAAQKELQQKYYRRFIPHVTILDRSGKVLYDAAGEVEESQLASILDRTLN